MRLLKVALGVPLRGEPNSKCIRQVEQGPFVACLSRDDFKFIDLGSQPAFLRFAVDTEDHALCSSDIIAPRNGDVFTIGLYKPFNSAHEATPFLLDLSIGMGNFPVIGVEKFTPCLVG